MEIVYTINTPYESRFVRMKFPYRSFFDTKFNLTTHVVVPKSETRRKK